MRYNVYSRLNQHILDALVISSSLYLAYLVRYAGAIPPHYLRQFVFLLAPVVLGRLLVNYCFGSHRIRWRYISAADAVAVSRSYLAFSLVLVGLRFVVPNRLEVLRIPVSVIIIEFLLSLLGSLAIRLTRRYVYEGRLRKLISSEEGPRRVLLIGAGQMGAHAAKELAADQAVRIVGFLDDDPEKLGCVVAGAKVLGSTSALPGIVRREKVDSVLVCIAPGARGSFHRLVALLDGLPVTSKFIPTITEILESKDGLHLSVVQGSNSGNGNHVSEARQSEMTAAVEHREVKNRCVLITGGAGFIGSSLAERLAKNNQIILLDRFFENQPIAFTSLESNKNVRLVEADILEAPIEELAAEADIVIHAAAIVGVGKVCNYPRETLETNFTGTSRILKALEKNSDLERFVYFSTSEVFGVNSFRVSEDTPTAVGSATEARWSYAIAKLAGEHLVKAYHRQTGMPVTTVRPFNVFGPRRLGAHAVLGFVLNALSKTPIEIHGDGSQIRSWCYIDDFCDAILEMIARPKAVGEDFNIGNPQNTLTILQLAQEIVHMTRSSSVITFIKSPFPDIEIRVPSLTKALEILDFEPKYDLRTALQHTVDWYCEHLAYFESRIERALAAKGH